MLVFMSLFLASSSIRRSYLSTLSNAFEEKYLNAALYSRTKRSPILIHELLNYEMLRFLALLRNSDNVKIDL